MGTIKDHNIDEILEIRCTYFFRSVLWRYKLLFFMREPFYFFVYCKSFSISIFSEYFYSSKFKYLNGHLVKLFNFVSNDNRSTIIKWIWEIIYVSYDVLRD